MCVHEPTVWFEMKLIAVQPAFCRVLLMPRCHPATSSWLKLLYTVSLTQIRASRLWRLFRLGLKHGATPRYLVLPLWRCEACITDYIGPV